MLTNHLFSPFTLREITLKNRIGVSPMCQYSSEDGFANDWHLVHLGSRAVGGAGLVIVEATAVSPEGRISPKDLGIWQDEHIPELTKITTFIKQHGAAPGIQIAHAGRKASTATPWQGGGSLTAEQGAWETIAPSALSFGGDISHVPQAMEQTDINKVIADFVAAAKRAQQAGFQWLEIHAAHGYLLHSFLSPLANKRTDKYGGSLENRARLLYEVATAVRKAWPEKFPLAVRLSCTDWIAEGFTLDESVEVAKQLKLIGVDLVDCSSGFVVPDISTYPFGAAWQVPLSHRIREEADIATAAVGSITEATHADAIIRNGEADIVLLAKQLLRDPYWPYHAAVQLKQNDPIILPRQYARAVGG